MNKFSGVSIYKSIFLIHVLKEQLRDIISFRFLSYFSEFVLFFHLILFSYFIDFVSFRYIFFSYFTDFVVSFRWISFHSVEFRILTLQISFHFVGFRFLTLQISLDFVFVSFRFVSFRFSVYRYPYETPEMNAITNLLHSK